MTGNRMTVKEAVELSGLTRQMIYNLLVNGRVAFEKFGHVYMIDRRSMVDYLRSPRHRGQNTKAKSE